jgi:outer membrane receptor protein involved in Fe transport
VVNILTQEGYGKFHGNFTSETSYPFTVADRYFSENESASEALKKSGGLSLWGVNGTGSGGGDKAGYLVSAGYRTIGNYLLRDSAEVKDHASISYKKADNYGYTDYRFFGKAKYYPSGNSELSLNVRYFNSDLGVGKTKNILPDSQDIITKGEKILVGPQAKVTVSDWFTMHASGFFRHVTGEFWNEGTDSSLTPVRTYWKSQTNDWQIESQGFLTLGSGNTMTTGVEFLRNSADFGATADPATGQTVPNSFPMQKAIVNGAGYVQDEWKPFEGLNIVPVARLDYHSVFGGAFSPKLGVSYQPFDRFRVRASAGRSFRAPSLAELYLPDLQINPSFLLRANPGLKPEYIWGFDGGIDVKAHENVTVTLGGFYNTMDNLISQTLAQDSSTLYVTHRNVISAWSRGVEMEASWKALSWLTAAGHATLENSLDRTYNVSLDYVPDLLFGCSAIAKRNFKVARIEGQAVFNYVGARSYLDFTGLHSSPQGTWGLAQGLVHQHPYGTVDLSCKVTLSRGLWFALTAQNLLNAEYEEAAGTLAPGRLALIKIGLDF